MSVRIGLPEASWDEVVAKQNCHFLQSRNWAKFQVELGRTVLSDAGVGWSWLATVHEVSGFHYLSIAYGPTVNSKTLEAALESVVEAAREQKCDFVRIEPIGVDKSELEKCSSMLVPIEEIEPEITSVIDLSLSEETLRRNLASGHRNAINGASRRGISIRQGDVHDMTEFVRLINKTAQKLGIRMHDAKYFETMMKVLEPLGAVMLYVAEVEGRVVAGTIIYQTEKTWYYAHAASDPEFVKLQAGVPLLWRAILDARSSGAQEFDLWGVVPEGDTASSKSGYSRFKRAFGGIDKAYAGTWDLVVNPARYRVFRLARSAMQVIRKLSRS